VLVLFLVSLGSVAFVVVEALSLNCWICARVYECIVWLYEERDVAGETTVEFDEYEEYVVGV
jgi:hypothetical protein